MCLDRSYPLPGGQMAITVAGNPVGCVEDIGGLGILPVIDMHERLAGERACPPVIRASLAADGSGQRVAVGGVAVLVAVEEDLASELEQVARQDAQLAVHGAGGAASHLSDQGAELCAHHRIGLALGRGEREHLPQVLDEPGVRGQVGERPCAPWRRGFSGCYRWHRDDDAGDAQQAE